MRTPGNSANTETGFLNPALPGLSGDSLLASGSEASTDQMPTGHLSPLLGLRMFRWGPHPCS